jgi:hypothetical protein
MTGAFPSQPQQSDPEYLDPFGRSKTVPTETPLEETLSPSLVPALVYMFRSTRARPQSVSPNGNALVILWFVPANFRFHGTPVAILYSRKEQMERALSTDGLRTELPKVFSHPTKKNTSASKQTSAPIYLKPRRHHFRHHLRHYHVERHQSSLRVRRRRSRW